MVKKRLKKCTIKVYFKIVITLDFMIIEEFIKNTVLKKNSNRSI